MHDAKVAISPNLDCTNTKGKHTLKTAFQMLLLKVQLLLKFPVCTYIKTHPNLKQYL